VVGFCQVSSEEEALRLSRVVLEHGGVGHTAVIHARDPALIARFASELPVLRLLANTPATQGAWGGICTALPPSITLGTGTAASNYLDDNLSPRHLLQLRREVRWHEREKTPRKIRRKPKSG